MRIPHIFSFFKNFFLVSVARKTTAIAAAAPAEARAVLAVPAIPARSRDAVPLSSFHRCRSARAICSSTAKCSRSETAFSVKPPVVKTNQMNFSSSGRELFNNEKKNEEEICALKSLITFFSLSIIDSSVDLFSPFSLFFFVFLKFNNRLGRIDPEPSRRYGLVNYINMSVLYRIYPFVFRR